MQRKQYFFELPKIHFIATHPNAYGDSWMDAQKFPVYALIPACSDCTSTASGGYWAPVTELECLSEPTEQNNY